MYRQFFQSETNNDTHSLLAQLVVSMEYFIYYHQIIFLTLYFLRMTTPTKSTFPTSYTDKKNF